MKTEQRIQKLDGIEVGGTVTAAFSSQKTVPL